MPPTRTSTASGEYIITACVRDKAFNARDFVGQGWTGSRSPQPVAGKPPYCDSKSRSDFGYGRMVLRRRRGVVEGPPLLGVVPTKMRTGPRWSRSGRSEGFITFDESRH